MIEEVKLIGTPPRDEQGKFISTKRPLEFTWPHFWLEVAEIAVGILIAQIVIDIVSIWLKRL